MRIDVAMPTYDSAGVVEETLDRMHAAVDASPFEPGAIYLADGGSADGSVTIIREWCAETPWQCVVAGGEYSLPKAREQLTRMVDSDWFLFLDDDVRLHEGYLDALYEWTSAPGVGAVHGRKSGAYDGPPSEWVRMRSKRGATHATLVRTAAVRECVIPEDLHVLEDEFLRRCIEETGYNWVFDHRAQLDHDCQGRHPVGWQEGYLAGKYGLLPAHWLLLHIPYSVATFRNPWPHVKRAVGWTAGRFRPGAALGSAVERGATAIYRPICRLFGHVRAGESSSVDPDQCIHCGKKVE